MNILLIDENPSYLSRFKPLLEIAFTHAVIKTETLEIPLHSLFTDYTSIDIVIILNTTGQIGQNKKDLLCFCKLHSLPSLIIVNRNIDIDCMQFLQYGANGLIGQDSPLDILRNGIRFALDGGTYIDPKIAKDINFTLYKQSSDSKSIPPSFTKREWEILDLLAKDYTDSEIADILKISPLAVTSIQQGILKKMNTKTLTSAVAKAVCFGWILFVN